MLLHKIKQFRRVSGAKNDQLSLREASHSFYLSGSCCSSFLRQQQSPEQTVGSPDLGIGHE
jgi:hypothetical protein